MSERQTSTLDVDVELDAAQLAAAAADPGPPCAADLQEVAERHFVSLLTMFNQKQHRMPFLRRMVARLRRRDHPARMLRICWAVLDKFNISPVPSDPATKTTAAAELQEELGLLQLVLEDLSATRAAAHAHAEAQGWLSAEGGARVAEAHEEELEDDDDEQQQLLMWRNRGSATSL